MFKILIIEDDDVIKRSLFEWIERWGFKAKYVEDLKNILEEFSDFQPHLVLLDINLPYFDGYYWCNKIREISKIPIIFISSRSSSMDLIMAINMGGDDFIQKPFLMDVVIAKINGLLRRTYSYANEQMSYVEYKGVVLNLTESSVAYENYKTELTRNELKILHILMKDNGHIISRDRIMRYLWEDESFVDDGTLAVNINRLRRKLEDMGLGEFIQTKKRQGYIII